MIKKVKCNVCNYKFLVEKTKVKQVVDNTEKEMICLSVTNKTKESKIYDAIDCPKCGCQKVLWPRLPEDLEICISEDMEVLK